MFGKGIPKYHKLKSVCMVIGAAARAALLANAFRSFLRFQARSTAKGSAMIARSCLARGSSPINRAYFQPFGSFMCSLTRKNIRTAASGVSSPLSINSLVDHDAQKAPANRAIVQSCFTCFPRRYPNHIVPAMLSRLSPRGMWFGKRPRGSIKICHSKEVETCTLSPGFQIRPLPSQNCWTTLRGIRASSATQADVMLRAPMIMANSIPLFCWVIALDPYPSCIAFGQFFG